MPSISDSHHSNKRNSPSFENCHPATATSSQIKQRNRKKDTSAEIALRRKLWKRGLRYRLHTKGLPGTPDVVFLRPKVVVFIDGDFWHGRDWDTRKKKLSRGANPTYWVHKISYNRKRDRENNEELIRMGWLVVRLWETDIRNELEACAECVQQLIATRIGGARNRQGPGYVYRFTEEREAPGAPFEDFLTGL